MTLEPSVKVRGIANIETWTTAFQIYVAIYTAQHPSEAPALMKYGEIVRDLASRGFNWRYYDENFRFLRQTDPQGLPWSSIHSELWIRSQPPINQKASYFKGSGQGADNRIRTIPQGYCYRFHRGSYCSGCAFKHDCPSCNNKHSLSKCNFRGSRDKPTSTATAGNASANTSKAK